MIDGRLDIQEDDSKKERSNMLLWNMALTYSTVMFINGAAPTFPTIQNDMKDKNRFHMAVSLAYAGSIYTYMYNRILVYSDVQRGPKNAPNSNVACVLGVVPVLLLGGICSTLPGLDAK